jgi:replicative DNA helicase Mcm
MAFRQAESIEQSNVQSSPFVECFREFFELRYKREIQKLAEDYPASCSLNVDWQVLAEFDATMADELLDNPDFMLLAAELALQGFDLPVLEEAEFKPRVRIYNLPPDREVMLKELSAKHLNKLVCVEGVVKQITDVLPKLKVAVWKCNGCNAEQHVPQSRHNIVPPVICPECKSRNFTLLTDESTFIDSQKMQIQEPLEQLRGNEQPTSLDIHLAEDLVNKVGPGDRVVVVGVLRLYPTKGAKVVFNRYLDTVYLETSSKEFEDLEITPDEEKQIKELARQPDIYERLVKSVAPNIYGHEDVKEAIMLQMFGGVKKVLPNEQTIRGNIHILLIGDPGVAKSQLLQAAHNIAPKSIYVGGKTTSAVGLTATAVKDEFGEGGWTLKAGALVLASGGITMADELDKMDAEDRTALHEAMEQGTISVAKAGIVTRFKTDTSILAAANPKFSRFDPYEPFIKQIDLPPTLVSRFDLFFMIRDVLDRTLDTEIAQHILKTHQAGEMLYQHKLGKKLKKRELRQIEEMVKPAIEPELLRKYIAYARKHVFPTLTPQAMKTIIDFYVDLREKGKQEGSYTATHRQLEGLVRLAEASARVRLSDKVEEQDAARAIRLLKLSLQDVVVDPQTGRIDIDIITTGQPHSQVELMKNLLALIKDKAAEQDMVAIEEIVEEAKAMGISEQKAKEIIEKLEKKGELYRPRHGFVRPTA